MNRCEFFSQLWDHYTRVTPQASKIHQLLRARGEVLENDHVAFRTFNQSLIDLKAFKRVLNSLGYQAFDHYYFPDKHLDAVAFKTDHLKSPKIFVSELRRQELSSHSQAIINDLLESCSIRQLQAEHLFNSYPWPRLSYDDYLELATESEYAAWLSTMGLRANHFTVAVNSLDSFPSLKALNTYLLDQQFQLNQVGGLIKGHPTVYLEQSSTLADRITFDFSCGLSNEVPSCYYEFAYRYPLADGSIFQGFVTQNAKNIFESTHR